MTTTTTTSTSTADVHKCADKNGAHKFPPLLSWNNHCLYDYLFKNEPHCPVIMSEMGGGDKKQVVYIAFERPTSLLDKVRDDAHQTIENMWTENMGGTIELTIDASGQPQIECYDLRYSDIRCPQIIHKIRAYLDLRYCENLGSVSIHKIGGGNFDDNMTFDSLKLGNMSFNSLELRLIDKKKKKKKHSNDDDDDRKSTITINQVEVVLSYVSEFEEIMCTLRGSFVFTHEQLKHPDYRGYAMTTPTRGTVQVIQIHDPMCMWHKIEMHYKDDDDAEKRPDCLRPQIPGLECVVWPCKY